MSASPTRASPPNMHAATARRMPQSANAIAGPAAAQSPLAALQSRAGNRATSMAMLGAGAPLPAHVREEMEARFGADFGAVRVHDDLHAHDQAMAHLARAFTVGEHIVFNADFYAPQSGPGRRLLAHELAHVVQQTQRQGGVLAGTQHEVEADAAASAVSAGQTVTVASAAGTGVQAEPLSRTEIAALDLERLKARVAANEEESRVMVRPEEELDALADEHLALQIRYSQLSGSVAATTSPGAPAAPSDTPGTTGRPRVVADAARYAVKGVRPFGGEVPTTDGSGGLPAGHAGQYILGPNAIQCEDGNYAPLYYVAYHKERKRNEWIVGPASVAEFQAQQECLNNKAAAVSQADPAPGAEQPFPPSIPLHPQQAKADVAKGTELYFMTKSVPPTSQAGQAVAVGDYDLIPQQLNTATGEAVTMYYLARDRQSGHDHYVVGPDDLEKFKAEAGPRLNAARFAYQNGAPHEYEADSVRWVNGAMNAALGDGKWSDAFGHLGSAWGGAVHDPKFQLQAILSSVPVGRVVGPLARVVGRRAAPYLAASMIGLEEGLPAVRVGGAPTAALVENMEQQAVTNQARQVATSEATQIAVNQASRVAGPTMLSRSATALPSVVPQLAGVGTRAAAIQAAPALGSPAAPSATQGLRDVDPAVSQAVDQGIVETPGPMGEARTPRPPRVPRSADATQARADFNGPVRDANAQALQVALYGQVHHAIEVQVLSRYPGVYTPGEINQAANMRGIPPELLRRTQLHNSKIREVLDRHYVGLDAEIARRGLAPGTPAYDQLVRAWLDDARAEIDWSLGQFFSEQRATLFPPTP